jgi:hypothetical protein
LDIPYMGLIIREVNGKFLVIDPKEDIDPNKEPRWLNELWEARGVIQMYVSTQYYRDAKMGLPPEKPDDSEIAIKIPKSKKSPRR